MCLLLVASIGFSQTKSPTLKVEPQEGTMFNYNGSGNDEIQGVYTENKKAKRHAKVYEDTLAYEDFDGGLNGWKVTDVNNNGNVWEWNTVYRTGNGTGGFSAIQSTTGSNGFLSLPIDFYNSPRPANFPNNISDRMNTFVTSPAIKLKKKAKSVFISFEQYHARCCFFTDMMLLKVSKDSVNWITIDVDEDVPLSFANQGAANITPVRYNISEAAADADSLYIRFQDTLAVLWFWMIDDVTIIEGPKNDLVFNDPKVRFFDSDYGIAPTYGTIPYDIFPPLEFQGTIFNNGSDSSRNAKMEVDVTRVNNLNGTFVNEHLYSQSEFVTNNVLAPFTDSLNSEVLIENDLAFSPLSQGDFRVNYRISSDSTEQITGNEEDSAFFTTSDTVFALDDGAFTIGNGTGPVSISQGPSVGGFDGDACGVLYIIDSSRSQGKVIPTSISFYVSTDESNDGISISPSVWFFKEDTNIIENAWLPEDFNNTTGRGLLLFGDIYQVQMSDTNTFLTLSLDTAGFTGLGPGQYMVGWEVISGSTAARDVYFEVANDQTTAARQPAFTSLLYHANSTPKNVIFNNAQTQFQPVIRLNIATLPIQTSVEDPSNSKSEIFEVVPNPSSGQIKINIAVETTAIYNLSVRNMLGQVVYSDVLPVNGAVTERIDLSSLSKGAYFLTLENTNEKLQQKIILK